MYVRVSFILHRSLDRFLYIEIQQVGRQAISLYKPLYRSNIELGTPYCLQTTYCRLGTYLPMKECRQNKFRWDRVEECKQKKTSSKYYHGKHFSKKMRFLHSRPIMKLTPTDRHIIILTLRNQVGYVMYVGMYLLSIYIYLLETTPALRRAVSYLSIFTQIILTIISRFVP